MIRCMSVFIASVTALFSVLLPSCGRDVQSDSSATPVRVFQTPAVLDAESIPPGLQATVSWRTTKRLGAMEISSLADQIIDSSPTWGAYTGVSQSEVDSKDMQNHLSVTLTSRNSVDEFVRFCAVQMYAEAVVLMHCDADQLFQPRIEEIVDRYPERP